ncbi:MAG: response regulator transcription factor [Acidimicrobiales bacterium]
MPSVYVVEDDHAIRAALCRTLAERGHSVRSQGTALGALAEILACRPDVVVLDLGLPDRDGAELLHMLRGVSDVPVVIATARDEDAEVIRLLDAGADDYVVKPFSAAQMEARIRAVLRRGRAARREERVCVGGLVLDHRRRSATLDERELELTRKEFDLLAYLAQRPGEVVSKQELLAEVWRHPFGGGDKTVDVHISWLRRKLGETAATPRYLHTVRGVGVRLNAPPETSAAGSAP